LLWEFSIIFLTLVYLGVLWIAYSHPENFLWPGAIFLLILLVSVKAISRKYFHSVIPAFLAAGTALLLPLIDSLAEKKAFIVLSVGIFYLAILGAYRLGKYEKDLTAKAMLNLAALSVLFCWFASAYGWYLNIAIPVWMIMTIFAVVSFSISYALFVINQLKMNQHQRFLYAIFMAYLSAGSIWIQNFWPFGYLTTGVITLIIFYSGWEIIKNYFLEKLTLRRLTTTIIFLAGAATLVLLSARWYPMT
jgi:hypothetical protein